MWEENQEAILGLIQNNSYYLKEAKDAKINPVSRSCFTKYLKGNNFSLYKPRKDQCDVCCSFKTSQIPEDVYQNHVKSKDG